MKSSLPSIAALAACAAALARAEVYFREDFSADKLDTDRWVASEARPDYGAFEVGPGAWFADEKKSRGLRTTQDYRFYALSAPLEKVFDTTGKDLVVQFSAKNEQIIECGGGYLKLMPPDFLPKNFTGDSPFELMFGPDICGSTHRLHVIFRYKGEGKLIKKDITCPDDHFTHLYTLIVKPDQTYKILVDQKEKLSGSLLEDWDFLSAKTIKGVMADVTAKSAREAVWQRPHWNPPEDWVDEEMMDDPQDTKPEGYDDIPEFIPTEKPADWDDDADGEWIPANKENPEYKGKWTPKKIKNPNYKGEWVHPEIPNPDYVADDTIYVRNIGFIGFDLWQVKSGTIFDDILISD
ncbi:MAG: calreticulin, partial [Olpidium bornovanus]